MKPSVRSLPPAIAALLLLLAAPAAAQDYRIRDVDGNQLLSASWPVRAPDPGPMLGGGLPFGYADPQPVWWDAAGSHLLPILPGDEAGVANDANSQGRMVGESDDIVIRHLIYIYPHAVVWENGQSTALATLVVGGDPMDMWAAMGINEAGQILGFGKQPGTTSARAFLFENGIVTDLGTLQGGGLGRTEPGALNEQGQVVGESDVAGGFRHAVLWENGALTDLHDPSVLLGRTSRANDVNERGQICGSGDYIGDLVDWETATLWDNGTILSLGTLGGNESWAYGVNDHGDVVGGSTNALHQNVAFLWRDGFMVDLNTRIPPGSGWWLLDARDIGNDGRILGTGSFGGALRAYVLEPDQDGFFQVYGYGCAGAGGFTPRLWGAGAPTPGGAISLAITNGVGGSVGRLLAGKGTGVRKLAPGCDLQILPLLPQRLDLVLAGAGAGAGWQQLELTLPASVAAGDYYLQAGLVDRSLAHGFTVTQPLQVGVR